MIRYALVIVALAAMIFAACGDDDSGPTPTPDASGNTVAPVGTFDPNATATSRPTRTATGGETNVVQPCSLISALDVQGMIGAVTTVTPKEAECNWVGDLGMLNIKYEKTDAQTSAAERLGQIAGSDAEEADVGDEGFFADDDTLTARKGVYVFTLETTKQDAKDSLLALAQSAANNLPRS